MCIYIKKNIILRGVFMSNIDMEKMKHCLSNYDKAKIILSSLLIANNCHTITITDYDIEIIDLRKLSDLWSIGSTTLKDHCIALNLSIPNRYNKLIS
jgi:hypothetical protein